MKTPFILSAACALLLSTSLHAQTTLQNIRVDLLKAAQETNDYAAAADLFDKYDDLSADMSLSLQKYRAKVYSSLGRYSDAKKGLEMYLQGVKRDSDDYKKAISMLAEVMAEERVRQTVNENLLAAVKENKSSEEIRGLLEKGADVNAKDKDGYTLLHMAAANGNTETAKVLLEQGVDVNAKDKDGYTPLHMAAANGNTETAEVLLKLGADVNAKDVDGVSPFLTAASKGHLETAVLLSKYRRE